jgi:hypothetical protein
MKSTAKTWQTSSSQVHQFFHAESFDKMAWVGSWCLKNGHSTPDWMTKTVSNKAIVGHHALKLKVKDQGRDSPALVKFSV